MITTTQIKNKNKACSNFNWFWLPFFGTHRTQSYKFVCKLYLLLVHCLFERFVNMYLFSMFVNNHTCALVLLFRNVCYQTCDILPFCNLFFFLRWNYLCLGIEPLFDLSIFTAVDKVKDRILYNKVWKDNWTYWDTYTCQYYILYCSIFTIWVHFKRNYNLFDQVLITVITFVLFSLYLNRSWLLPITSLTQACLSLNTWMVHYLMNLLIKD
jgi:hypothetical protein